LFKKVLFTPVSKQILVSIGLEAKRSLALTNTNWLKLKTKRVFLGAKQTIPGGTQTKIGKVKPIQKP
jgi:hypothetical protein